jgi:hypothetical protein
VSISPRRDLQYPTCVRAPPALVNEKKISWQGKKPLPPEGGSLDSKTYIFPHHHPKMVVRSERAPAPRRDN